MIFFSTLNTVLYFYLYGSDKTINKKIVTKCILFCYEYFVIVYKIIAMKNVLLKQVKYIICNATKSSKKLDVINSTTIFNYVTRTKIK